MSASILQGAADRGLGWFSPSRPLFHLFYGGVIVLLATPCTAPFLGGAVAFALTQSLAMILAIFLMIALGLAVPWLILFFLPQKARALVELAGRGRASLMVQQLSAWLLYGAALWLLWVLAAQIGAVIAAGLFAAFHLALWLKARSGAAALAAVMLVIISPLALPVRPEPIARNASDALTWHRFDIGELRRQVEMGKTVFVDIGAEWCLTCQYNKANVLSDRDIRWRLRQKDIYLIYGDLTNPDQKITDFLKQNHRVGIPFNAIYHKDGRKILSEILDKESLLASLNAH